MLECKVLCTSEDAVDATLRSDSHKLLLATLLMAMSIWDLKV